MVTELELINNISEIDSELKILRKEIDQIDEEWESAHTRLGELNLNRKNSVEELRRYRISFVSKELTDRQLEIISFKERMSDVLKNT